MNHTIYHRKKGYFQLKFLVPACMLLLAVAGCTKWDKLTSPNEGSIYMPQAYSTRSELHVLKIDSPQTFVFGASMAGFDGAKSDIMVDFEVDNSLLDGFNQANSYLNYNFQPLPKGAFEIPELQTVIGQGKSDSKPLSFSILANRLSSGIDYCLPIRIKSVSEGSIDTMLSVSYFMIDSLYIRSRDVTSRGTLSVSIENYNGANSAESSGKLVDNNYTTKYLYQFQPNSWMELKLDTSLKLNAYTLTSGNDASGRDPKAWQLQGSADGSNWVTLDERSGFAFTSRRQTVTFELNHPDDQSYSYYRLVILENNGESLFQMTEWRLLQYY